MTYRTIVADPPWPYAKGDMPRTMKIDGTRAAGTSVHTRYGAMTISDLCAIRPPAGENAHLYLWTTNAFMDEAHDVARAWGFAPKTILTWTKTHHGDSSRVSMKTGYYFRGATEHCLFCVRGSLKLKSERGLPTGYLWPRLPHSVKPDAFYDLVEEASYGPYLELFARRARFDWDYWGDQSLGTAEMGEDVAVVDSPPPVGAFDESITSSVEAYRTTQDLARVSDLILALEAADGELRAVDQTLNWERLPYLTDTGATMPRMSRIRVLGDKWRRAEQRADRLERELKRLRAEFRVSA
jgi:N6-adenosine-specific RNA methylase IME4